MRCGSTAQMVRWKQVPASASAAAAARAAYRPDLYRFALQTLGLALPSSDTKVEGRGRSDDPGGFFDGKVFDPDDIDKYLNT